MRRFAPPEGGPNATTGSFPMRRGSSCRLGGRSATAIARLDFRGDAMIATRRLTVDGRTGTLGLYAESSHETLKLGWKGFAQHAIVGLVQTAAQPSVEV